jgi:hypothetical protein
MARKPVTLAPVRSRQEIEAEEQAQREGRALAEVAVRKFGAMGATRSDGPTPERLLRAGGAARVERFTEAEERWNDEEGRPETVEVERVRIRADASPFERLCKGRFVAKDKNRNFVLCQAGLRYRETWTKTGLTGPRSVDFGRVGVSTNSGLFATEMAASAFNLLTKIEQAMQREQTRVCRGVILEDREAVDVGRDVTGYAAPKQAAGTAMFLLRSGLESAARVLGLSAPVATGRE